MCGICGYYSTARPNLRAMLDTLSHRGPDDEGVFRNGNVGLGHKRLSIIDDKGGRQPMRNADGNLTIVFNGEIYNYRELRSTLKVNGHYFRTESDTEVLLAMYEHHGRDMLTHLNGMFAFVIHDATRNILFGARDRLGIKPFYLSTNPKGLFFASEIKAILEGGQVDRTTDHAGLSLYMMRRFIPGERTIYKHVRKLRPGHFFVARSPTEVEEFEYWSIPESTGPVETPPVEHFGELLDSSVTYRMLSDVPLGAFLSGGIDSTAIIASMAERSCSPLKTFTIGFSEDDPEVLESRRTSRFFSCEHTIGNVVLNDFAMLPKLLHHMDGPYGDPILIPLFKLSQLASRSVKVVLSGDGADETQFGYIHHESLSQLWKYRKRYPSWAFEMGRLGLAVTPVTLLDRFFKYPDSMGPEGKARLRQLLSPTLSAGEAYQNFANLFSPSELQTLVGPDLQEGLEEAMETFLQSEEAYISKAPDPLKAILNHDLRHWLPDNILLKYDKMTMAASIEGRAPFLDHRLVEFLASLPSSHSIRKGTGKQILQQHFTHRFSIPGRSSNRKKPFYFPMERQYRASLSEYIHDNIDFLCHKTGIFNETALRRIVEDAGKSSLVGGKRLFTIAALTMWCHNSYS